MLVVEDDPDVRAYTEGMVGELGYRVLAAADGAAALKVLDAHPEVDLLFTDVGLPGGRNGRQLADEARQRHPRLKVLFTTGYARDAIVHGGRLDRGVEVVFKPFRYSELALRSGRCWTPEDARPASPSSLEEHSQVLRQEHVLVEQDLAPGKQPASIVAAQQVVAAAGEQVGLGLDPVLVDDEAAADLDLARRRDRRAGRRQAGYWSRNGRPATAAPRPSGCRS